MTKTSLVLDTTTVEFLDGSGGQVILTQDEAALITRTSYYVILGEAALGNGATFSVLFRTAAPETNVKPAAFLDGTGLAEMFQNTVVSDDGTPGTVFPRNLIDPLVSQSLVFTDPTITDPGDSLGQFQIDTGGNKNAPPTAASFPLQWVVGPGDYMLQVTNISGAALSVQVTASLFERE